MLATLSRWRDPAITAALALTALLAAAALALTLLAPTQGFLLIAALIGAGVLLVAALMLGASAPIALASLPALPGAAAVATVGLALLKIDPRVAIGAGAVATVAAALLISVIGRHLGAAARVNPRAFADLESERDTLEADRLSWCQAPATPTASYGCQGAAMHLAAAQAALSSERRGESRWVAGTGYVEVAVRLHRAEESLLLAAPDAALAAAVRRDALRVGGSRLQRSSEGLTRLVAALAATLAGGAAVSEPQRWLAREFRRALNEFRDDRSDGLVRAKNRLVRTLFLTGGSAYLLLALALLLGADEVTVGHVSVLYLVGAVVGLFGQLRSDARSASAVEDYGLTTVRLIHVPLLSGVAAVAGVALAGLAAADPLSDLFDLTTVPTILVIAATFGLTPSLLVNRLQSEADRYKEDLQQTSAAKNEP